MNKGKTSTKAISRRSFFEKSGKGIVGLGLASTLVSSVEGATGSKLKENNSLASKQRIPIIDVHRHWMPQPSKMASNPVMRRIVEYAAGLEMTDGYQVTSMEGVTSVIYPEMADLEAQLKDGKKSEITKSLLSFAMGLEVYCKSFFMTSEEKLTARLNDVYAEAVAESQGQFEFMANINPFNKNSSKECERCFNELGAKGISIGTSWDGNYLGSPELDFFWEYAQDADQPIFLHPPLIPIGHKVQDEFKLEEVIGRPFDTTLTVAKMIFSGVFDRYPNLKIVIPHMGAALPMVVGRLDFTYRLGYKGLPKGQEGICKRKPSDYFKTNLYADTMGFNSLAIQHAIDLFGIDNIMFGSDYAAVPFLQAEHVEAVNRLNLTYGDQEKVFWKNANRLFKVI